MISSEVQGGSAMDPGQYVLGASDGSGNILALSLPIVIDTEFPRITDISYFDDN